MLVDKITSKEQLIEALADEFDACFDLSCPVIDLTDQIVAPVKRKDWYNMPVNINVSKMEVVNND